MTDNLLDPAHVAQAVAGDGPDLGLCAADERKPRDRSAAQIVEGKTGNARLLARDAKLSAKSFRRPRTPDRRGHDDWPALRCGIERGLEHRQDAVGGLRARRASSSSGVSRVAGSIAIRFLRTRLGWVASLLRQRLMRSLGQFFDLDRAEVWQDPGVEHVRC